MVLVLDAAHVRPVESEPRQREHLVVGVGRDDEVGLQAVGQEEERCPREGGCLSEREGHKLGGKRR